MKEAHYVLLVSYCDHLGHKYQNDIKGQAFVTRCIKGKMACSPENGITGSSVNERKMVANKGSFCLPIMPTTMLVLHVRCQ